MTIGPTARWLLALVAVVLGALVGLQASPAVWSLLQHVGLVAVPSCNDVFLGTVHAMCARPSSMEAVALAVPALGAVTAGITAWRLRRVTLAPSAEGDTAG